MCDSTSEDGIEARVDVIPFHESLLASGDGVVIPSLYVVLFEPLDSGWDGDLGITCGTSRCLARLAPGTLHCFFRAVQEAFGSIREKAATTCTCDHNVVGGVRPEHTQGVLLYHRAASDDGGAFPDGHLVQINHSRIQEPACGPEARMPCTRMGIREKAATTCTCDHNVVGGVRPEHTHEEGCLAQRIEEGYPQKQAQTTRNQ